MVEAQVLIPSRVDAIEKVTGRAVYAEDLPNLHGTLYGRVLRSPYSHARIRAIRTERAERLPGVVAVLTRDHLQGMDPYLRREGTTASPDQPFIAVDKARFDGEAVAAVAAESLAIADRALELMEVEYEELPFIFDCVEALAPGAPVLHEPRGSNLVGDYTVAWGDVAAGLRQADQVFEDTYSFPNLFQNPLENVGTCLAQFLNDEAILWSPIQHQYTAAEEVAALFGIEAEKVRIRMPYIGGGFGAKEMKPSILIALWLARKTGRPVRMMPSMEESFRNDARHALVYKARTGVKRDGTLVGLDVELWVDAGAYATNSMVTTRNAVVSAFGAYRVPHFRGVGHCVYTNKVPAGAFRGVGKAQSTWCCESNFDAIARQMGFDPLEFRLKNALKRGEQVLENATPLDADYALLMGRAARAIGWDGRSVRVGPAAKGKPAGPRLARGKGMAISLRHGYTGSGRAYAIAELDRRGKVLVRQNAVELGEGSYTVINRVASQALGLPQGQIEVSDPDTALNPYFDGVASQRTTVCMGNAVQRACEDLKRELLDVAVKAKGGRPEEWRLAEGRLWHGEQDYSLGEIVAGLGGTVKVIGMGSFSSPRASNPLGGTIPHWSVSVGAAEVEVDRETGEVHLLQYVNVADVGKAINPTSVRAQLDGGAIMGLGGTFFEGLEYREGHMANGDPMQYRLPLMADLPEHFTSLFVENGDGPGPFGSKGTAQVSIVVIAPAIAAAIYEAVGVRLKDLPITSENVLRGLSRL